MTISNYVAKTESRLTFVIDHLFFPEICLKSLLVNLMRGGRRKHEGGTFILNAGGDIKLFLVLRYFQQIQEIEFSNFKKS